MVHGQLAVSGDAFDHANPGRCDPVVAADIGQIQQSSGAFCNLECDVLPDGHAVHRYIGADGELRFHRRPTQGNKRGMTDRRVSCFWIKGQQHAGPLGGGRIRRGHPHQTRVQRAFAVDQELSRGDDFVPRSQTLHDFGAAAFVEIIAQTGGDQTRGKGAFAGL